MIEENWDFKRCCECDLMKFSTRMGDEQFCETCLFDAAMRDGKRESMKDQKSKSLSVIEAVRIARLAIAFAKEIDGYLKGVG